MVCLHSRTHAKTQKAIIFTHLIARLTLFNLLFPPPPSNHQPNEQPCTNSKLRHLARPVDWQVCILNQKVEWWRRICRVLVKLVLELSLLAGCVYHDCEVKKKISMLSGVHKMFLGSHSLPFNISASEFDTLPKRSECEFLSTLLFLAVFVYFQRVLEVNLRCEFHST